MINPGIPLEKRLAIVTAIAPAGLSLWDQLRKVTVTVMLRSVCGLQIGQVTKTLVEVAV